jgi:hypothetical protein
MIKDEGYGEGDAIELLRCSSQLPSLAKIADSLKKEIKELEYKEQNISLKIINLDEHLDKLEKFSEEKQSEFDELAHQIKIKQASLKVTEDFADLKISEDYLKINKIIENKVTSSLNNKNNLSMVSIVTALLAIRNDPEKKVLIDYFDYYNNPRNSFSDTNTMENYIQTYHPQLLEIRGMLHDKILKIVQNHVFPSLPKQ